MPTPTPRIIDYGHQRLRKLMPQVIELVMVAAASPEYDELLSDAVFRFYGVQASVGEIENTILADEVEQTRFFPWYLWDYLPIGAESTLGEQLIDGFKLPPELYEPLNHSILTGLRSTFVRTLTVTAIKGGDISLRDILSNETFRVYDPSLSSEIERDQLVVARLATITGDDHKEYTLIDALYAIIDSEWRNDIDHFYAKNLADDLFYCQSTRQLTPELLNFFDTLLDTVLAPFSDILEDGRRCVVMQAEIADLPVELCDRLEQVGDGVYALNATARIVQRGSTHRLLATDAQSFSWAQEQLTNEYGTRIGFALSESFERVADKVAAFPTLIGDNYLGLTTDSRFMHLLQRWFEQQNDEQIMLGEFRCDWLTVASLHHELFGLYPR